MRSRRIAYSYFPIQTLPWEAMAGRDSVNAVWLTSFYAAIAVGVIAVVVSSRVPRCQCLRVEAFGRTDTVIDAYILLSAIHDEDYVQHTHHHTSTTTTSTTAIIAIFTTAP